MKKVSLVIGVVSASLLTGCATLGVKHGDIGWGLYKFDAFAGQKVYAGYENIDQLDERRAVGHKPTDTDIDNTSPKNQNNNGRY